MGSHADIKREYKESAKQAGLFVIKNSVNGKIYLGSSLNLHGPLNKHRFMLSMRSHLNKMLQQEWKEFGADSFTFEIVEVVENKDDPNFSIEDELTLLEEIWAEKLQPFGELGYNRNGKIREA
jgi:group I intron endonuclease